jgi:hypothetical protein
MAAVLLRAWDVASCYFLVMHLENKRKTAPPAGASGAALVPLSRVQVAASLRSGAAALQLQHFT